MEQRGGALVDALFGAFVASLPEALRPVAGGLACTLALAPSPDVPWSEVFGHAVTLGAPELVADALPAARPQAARDASMAHLLAVIEAFGTDRVEDGQIALSAPLAAVLMHARRARDGAIARVSPSEASAYLAAQAETLASITEEQRIFKAREAVSFQRYLAVSLGKQRLGVPASVALAKSAGWDPFRRAAIARMLDGVWIGLQLHDDVVDWEDDAIRGGAWAIALGRSKAPIAEGAAPAEVKRAVLASGVLAEMLAGSAKSFRSARRRAQAIGAGRLAAWAREREDHVGDLSRREAESPGFTARARALSTWARTVLA
jgi:hypothetical protein